MTIQASLAVVWHLDANRILPRIPSHLAQLCNYWVGLVEDDAAAYPGPPSGLIGVPGEYLNIESVAHHERASLLAENLSGTATHVLFLTPDASIESDVALELPGFRQSQEVLFISADRQRARWQTALVPNESAYWDCDNHGRIKTCSNPQDHPTRNNQLRIISRQMFQRWRGPVESEVQILRAQLDNAPTANTAIAVELAEALQAMRQDKDALRIYSQVLEKPDDAHLAWKAHYGAALCLLELALPWSEVQTHLAAAFDLNPDRMEPLFHLVQHYHKSSDYDKACELAEIAYDIQEPISGKVFALDIHRYRLPQVYAECCYEIGKDERCIEIINRTLRRGLVPEPMRRELAVLRARAYERMRPLYPVSIQRRNRLLVIVTFRNAGEFLEKCVASIQRQDYKNYHVILIDDCSNDSALATLDELGTGFTIIVNEQRMGALYNQTNAVRQYAEADDIVVQIDGDDWLAHDSVFCRINDFFNRTRCRVMYGQYETSLGNYGLCEPLVGDAEKADAQFLIMHFPMHIRAYRASAFYDVIKQDPDLSVLKDSEGNFLDAAADPALIRALIQVAGVEYTRYNEEILYIYNQRNPESHYWYRHSVLRQRSESRLVADKPRLQQMDEVGNATGRRRKVKTLFLALDGMTPGLIEKWAGENELPNFQRLLERCANRRIEVPAGFGNDAFWNCFATGVLPDETGYFFRMRWDPQQYAIRFRTPGEQIRIDYFWTKMADLHREIGIMDIPEVKHGGRINGLEITEWLPHARVSETQTCPAALLDDLRIRFGRDPNKGSTERETPRSEHETERDIGLLLQSIGQTTRGASHYIKRGGWDFFAVGFQQAHDAGHQFWHLHDPSHPRYVPQWREKFGDPVLRTYKAIDDGVGSILHACGEVDQLVLMAGLAMGSKASCNNVLDQVLWEIDVHERRAAGQSFPLLGDFQKRRFFAIPHNDMSGAVRVNLRGREAEGVVREGKQYTEILVLLKERLGQVRNAMTGEPVVDDFVLIHDCYQGSRVNELPDMMVVWRRDAPINMITAPWLESPIKIRSRSMLDNRRGDHIAEAVLYSDSGTLIQDRSIIKLPDLHDQLVALIET